MGLDVWLTWFGAEICEVDAAVCGHDQVVQANPGLALTSLGERRELAVGAEPADAPVTRDASRHFTAGSHNHLGPLSWHSRQAFEVSPVR